MPQFDIPKEALAKSNKKDKTADTHSLVDIADIKDGVIISKTGKLCQILSVSTINYDLKSEEEQSAVIFQYQNFLNSLEFPIQIVMQSRKLDLTSYLKLLEARISQESNPLLKLQIAEYVDFVNKLISLVNIMDKEFYIIIPFSPPPSGAKGVVKDFIPGINLPSKKPSKKMVVKVESYKQELQQRVDVISSGLASIGLHCQPLDNKAAIKLFYNTYNPRLQQVQSMMEKAQTEGNNAQPKQTTSV